MDEYAVTSLDQLRAIFRQPSERVQQKKASRIDELTQTMLEASPFFLLASADADGNCDVTPRGGPPGQLRVLDHRRVAFPELSGNNLIDSLQNIVANPKAGLLVIIPGRDETVRVDGDAIVTTDPDVLSLWDDELRTPKVAVVLEVTNVFIHCAKAFRRGKVWDATTWNNHVHAPDASELFLEHVQSTDMSAQAVRESLDASYDHDLAAEKR